jgi:hypothetical protein
MHNERFRSFLALLVATIATTACETERPAPFVLAAPTPVGIESSQASAWDSAEDFRGWINNPLTEGTFSIEQQDGVEFVHLELKPFTAFRLWSPNLDPPFTRLRAVRVRYRQSPPPSDATAALSSINASVKPTVKTDPTNPLLPSYFSQVGVPSSTWQSVDLLAQSGRGYPAVVDALSMYLSFGRSGNVSVDIDRIELLR